MTNTLTRGATGCFHSALDRIDVDWYLAEDFIKGLTRETLPYQAAPEKKTAAWSAATSCSFLTYQSGDKASHSKGEALGDLGLGSLDRYLKGETKCQPTLH